MIDNKEKDNKMLLLFSTPGCHLCDQAKTLIQSVDSFKSFTLKVIDIADNDMLFERYGIRIPVIKFEHADDELGWPFDMEALRSYLAAMLIKQ